MSLKNLVKTHKVCITDYLNVFSDFREIKYKRLGLNFHTLKYTNKKEDTFDFFELFFTKYTKFVKTDSSYQYLFVLKKIYNYEQILLDVLKLYNNLDIKFIIIDEVYSNILIDKNKDDFLCQYIFSVLTKFKNEQCVLISNDKFRDRNTYINLFNNTNINITILDKIQKINLSVNIDKNITSNFYKIHSLGLSKMKL